MTDEERRLAEQEQQEIRDQRDRRISRLLSFIYGVPEFYWLTTTNDDTEKQEVLALLTPGDLRRITYLVDNLNITHLNILEV